MVCGPTQASPRQTVYYDAVCDVISQTRASKECDTCYFNRGGSLCGSLDGYDFDTDTRHNTQRVPERLTITSTEETQQTPENPYQLQKNNHHLCNRQDTRTHHHAANSTNIQIGTFWPPARFHGRSCSTLRKLSIGSHMTGYFGSCRSLWNVGWFFVTGIEI